MDKVRDRGSSVKIGGNRREGCVGFWRGIVDRFFFGGGFSWGDRWGRLYGGIGGGQIALGLVLAPPVVAGFTWILLNTGPYVALYLWAFLFALSIFFMTIYPVLIAPLFNKFQPLHDGSLRCAALPP